MLNVTPNQQPRECGACVTVWAIICSIHPCKVVFFCSVAFIGFYSSLCCIGFCLSMDFVSTISCTFQSLPGNPLDFDTFNFSGVFRILTSCLCLCVALAFAAQEMKKNKYRNIKNSEKIAFFLRFGVLDASDALALRHRRQRRRRHIKATKYRAFSRLDRTVLSGTWFGLDWGKMQIADFARTKNGKIMKHI